MEVIVTEEEMKAILIEEMKVLLTEEMEAIMTGEEMKAIFI